MQPGSRHSVSRESIFEDVIDLYSERLDEIMTEYPFYMEFKHEIAVDVGGVTRDMFSAFFEELYVYLFDGCCLLYPAIHATININSFSILGAILSNAYLIAGVIPDRVAFPCLAVAFLGTRISISDSVLYMNRLYAH